MKEGEIKKAIVAIRRSAKKLIKDREKIINEFSKAGILNKDGSLTRLYGGKNERKSISKRS
ncbi:MAG: hypothetical protein GY782_04895 [Gammaproteobacteria bacterium]|nr:hypothetical protein [Gammaproteobacteria bacterium]